MDQWAPPQFILGVSTDAPAQSQAQVAVNPQANNNSVDTTLHWKVSGTIVVALIIIFGLQAMGFRFVTSANVSLGRG